MLIKNKSAFSVFPNPASDILNITGINKGLINCFDVFGRELGSVKVIPAGITSINISTFPNVFFLQTKAGEIKKVIKQILEK